MSDWRREAPKDSEGSKRWFFWFLVIGLTLEFLWGGPGGAWPADDASVAWQKAERWGEQEPDKPYVLFMHGCTGITQSERNWARVLGKLGYSVVMPDSLARPSRVQACDPRTASIRIPIEEWKVKVLAARHEEIAYSLAELGKRQPAKIFLMGHSEGGFAVSTWKQGGFDAYVVSGTNCRGILTEAGKPVLILRFSGGDPWDRGAGGNQCDGLERAGLQFFRLDGTGHDSAFDTGAQRAVGAFLGKQTGG